MDTFYRSIRPPKEIKNRCLNAGMDMVLTKPVKMKDLFLAIESCLRQEGAIEIVQDKGLRLIFLPGKRCDPLPMMNPLRST